jgi:hypothetical protein
MTGARGRLARGSAGGCNRSIQGHSGSMCRRRTAAGHSRGWQAGEPLTITSMPRADSSGGLHRCVSFNGADAVSTTWLVCGVDHRGPRSDVGCRATNDHCEGGLSATRVSSFASEQFRSVAAALAGNAGWWLEYFLPTLRGRAFRLLSHEAWSEQPSLTAACIT